GSVATRDRCGLVTVLDFGLALHEDDDRLTRANAIVGTPRTMAPEQLATGAPVDSRADVWALGIILFELLARRSPFDGATSAELCANIVSREPLALRSLRPDLPPALEAAVSRGPVRAPRPRAPAVHAPRRPPATALAPPRPPAPPSASARPLLDPHVETAPIATSSASATPIRPRSDGGVTPVAPAASGALGALGAPMRFGPCRCLDAAQHALCGTTYPKPICRCLAESTRTLLWSSRISANGEEMPIAPLSGDGPQGAACSGLETAAKKRANGTWDCTVCR